MANILEKFGLRPARQLNGSPFINAQNRYRIAANNSTAIFQGDLVIPFTSGTVGRAIANTSTSVEVFLMVVFIQILQLKNRLGRITILVQSMQVTSQHL